jgi:hypothetical protein
MAAKVFAAFEFACLLLLLPFATALLTCTIGNLLIATFVVYMFELRAPPNGKRLDLST